MLAISARLAPLPPRRFFISLLPSALVPPKKYTRLAEVFDPPFDTAFDTALAAVFSTDLTFLTATFSSLAAAARMPLPWPFLTGLALFLDLELDFDVWVRLLVTLGMGAYLP